MPFLTSAERASSGESADAWSFTLRADEPCFAGHFDGAPVLPGIAHVAIAIEACARLSAPPGPLLAIDDLRFLQPLGPGDRCAVRVSPAPDAIRFEIHRDGVLASRGHLRFADGGGR